MSEMQRIRIQKDFWVELPLDDVREGALDGHTLSVVLVRPDRSRVALDETGWSEDTLSARVSPEVQNYVGAYRLEVWLDKGMPHQTVADVVNAFCLVSLSTQEGEEEEESGRCRLPGVSLSQFASPFVMIEDTLESESPTRALSARQGKELAERIEAVRAELPEGIPIADVERTFETEEEETQFNL